MMHTQPERFIAETVDEQIDQLALARRDQQSSSELCVVQDLQGLYAQGNSPEQVRRSLDTIWARLADQISPAHQTLFSQPDSAFPLKEGLPSVSTHQHLDLISGDVRSNASARKEDHTRKEPLSMPVHLVPARPRRQSLRRTLSLSVLAAVVLLSVLSWIMVTHLATRVGSGPGSGTVTATPIPATPAPQNLRSQAQQLLAQFHQEVTAWGQTHQYLDHFNKKSYALDYEYGQQGMGGILDQMVQQAKSAADYQAALNLIQNELANLHAMEATSNDHTPWNQAHRADTSLLNSYKLDSGTVIVVSLVEQSLRVYQNGQLIEAFPVTTGRYENPTLPGSWHILLRQQNVTVKSSYPKSSPFWFPDTQVNYALSFHSGGYLINDSWWRVNYGPGTNFPHYDVGGDEVFAGNGPDGSINLSEGNMAKLYSTIQVKTPVVIY